MIWKLSSQRRLMEKKGAPASLAGAKVLDKTNTTGFLLPCIEPSEIWVYGAQHDSVEWIGLRSAPHH